MKQMTVAEALRDVIDLLEEFDDLNWLHIPVRDRAKLQEKLEDCKKALVCHCARMCGAQMFTEDMVFYTRRYGPLMVMEFTGDWDEEDPPNPIFLPWKLAIRDYPPESAMVIR